MKQKSEVAITDVRLKRKGELSPLIVEFLNGDIPQEKLSTVKAKIFPHENLMEEAIEISTPDNQKFVNESLGKTPMDHRFVAIRNRKTNKVRFVEVEFASLINALFSVKRQKTVDEKSIKEQFSLLQREFGAQKVLKRLEEREALETDQNFVEKQINELLENTPAEELSIVNETLNKTSNDFEEECLSNLIPPCYRDATSIFDVYKVEDCLMESEINSLSEGIEEILKNKKLANPTEFLEVHLPQALSTQDNLKVRLASLLYADALITYVKCQVRNLHKATLSPFSTEIGDKIFRDFCIKKGSSLNRPPVMKDKAICYIIVLTLIACNYSIDLEILAKLSSYSYIKMKQLGRIVGVLPAGKSQSIHTLVLPLPPPVKMVKKQRVMRKK